MSGRQSMPESVLHDLVQSTEIEKLKIDELKELFLSEKNPSIHNPDGVSVTDPRDMTPVLFNPGRARRPEDYSPSRKKSSSGNPGCVICGGSTTGIIDYKGTSNGFTFINKNLFPIVFPGNKDLYGFHFLQWTSNHHTDDWHTLPVDDCRTVLERVAAVERFFIEQENAGWYVSIIKNHGRLVGGSLTHGHQQIIAGKQKPQSIVKHEEFEREHGSVFSKYLLSKLSPGHVVKDYGSGVLVVPFFMKRPYDMLFLVRDTGKSYLHQLNRDEMTACAAAWHDALGVYHRLFPEIGRELAYNVIVHNGPGAGIYVEFLPYTQETGGFEQLGLYCSQGAPDETAGIIKRYLAKE